MGIGFFERVAKENSLQVTLRINFSTLILKDYLRFVLLYKSLVSHCCVRKNSQFLY